MKMHSPGHSSAASVTELLQAVGHDDHALHATRVGHHGGAVFHIGETVVLQREDRGQISSHRPSPVHRS